VSSFGNKLIGCCSASIPHCDGKACVNKPAGNCPAHRTEAEKTNLCHDYPFVSSVKNTGRLRSRSTRPCVDTHGNQQNRSQGNLLKDHIDTEQVESITNQGNKKNTNHSSPYGTFTTQDGRSTDNDSRVILVPRSAVIND
jgi:Tol biopolymer transport system component